MLSKLFPPSMDNRYRGRKAAIWLLGFIVLIKGAMGVNCIFNGYAVATTADGIPLETFTPDGAGAVVSFLAFWGWSLLLFCLLGVLALLRYRAMVPLVFLLLLLEQLGRKWILQALPIALRWRITGLFHKPRSAWADGHRPRSVLVGVPP